MLYVGSLKKIYLSYANEVRLCPVDSIRKKIREFVLINLSGKSFVQKGIPFQRIIDKRIIIARTTSLLCSSPQNLRAENRLANLSGGSSPSRLFLCWV